MMKYVSFLLLVALLFPLGVSAETTYGSDFITGGTDTCSTALGAPYNCEQVSDENLTTRWNNTVVAMPDFWSYDLGSGVSKSADKMVIWSYDDVNGQTIKDWTLIGSNDNFTTTSTVATGTQPDIADGASTTYEFINRNSYRYYKLNITSNYRADQSVSIYEVKMYESIRKLRGSGVSRQ